MLSVFAAPGAVALAFCSVLDAAATGLGAAVEPPALEAAGFGDAFFTVFLLAVVLEVAFLALAVLLLLDLVLAASLAEALTDLLVVVLVTGFFAAVVLAVAALVTAFLAAVFLLVAALLLLGLVLTVSFVVALAAGEADRSRRRALSSSTRSIKPCNSSRPGTPSRVKAR